MFSNKTNRNSVNVNTNNLRNTARNSYRAISSRYNRTSTTERIVLFFVLIGVLYFVYKYFFTNKKETYVFGLTDASEKKLIPHSKIPEFTMSDYSISIWFYIKDWNKAYGQEKYILGKYMKDPNTDEYKPVPSLTLDPFTNNIKVSLAYLPSSSTTSGSDIHSCVLNGIPLQKWTNIILSVNNRTLDIYLDGKLRRTCLVPGVPQGNASSDMFIAGSPREEDIGFSGFLSDLKIYTYAMNPREAYDIYKNGHSGASLLGSMANKYKIKMSVLEDNQEVNALSFP